ncbi:NADPH-dependent F420 reductase [Streptomyces kaniharaensis]|uniref:NADPH-dependent F420 reductase n=1 Tax=Streptomyces kaniharaensis TaxID=212423 RepID=UPI001E5B3808|nr:NAD(P)-binding domain-containing protein [Streptomyces kaniharaensis]
MTTIAVLGNGRVGGNLATALTRAGHEVTVADRTPGAAADAARRARIVINATPGNGSLDRLAVLREELRGKILVDVSNATTDGPDGLPADLIYPGSSLAEQLQEALPETHVVKTLNTMLFPVMTAPATLTQTPTAFLSGEDPQAKHTVHDPGGVFGQNPFQRGHLQLVQGVGVVRHRLLEFGDHETTVSTILPWMWPCAARVCALPASGSG